MDYQRPLRLQAAKDNLQGSFIHNYTDVTAYNVGATAAAAGFSLGETLLFSGGYNVIRGQFSNANTAVGLNQDRVNNITQGYNDFKNGKLNF